MSGGCASSQRQEAAKGFIAGASVAGLWGPGPKESFRSVLRLGGPRGAMVKGGWEGIGLDRWPSVNVQWPSVSSL